MQRFRKGVSFIIVILLVHVLLGAAAVLGDGRFMMGATFIERYLMHSLSGDENHLIFSGAGKEFINDFCVNSCASCQVYCYPESQVRLFCNDSCGLYTPKGVKVVSEGQFFSYVLKEALLVENSTFLCYNRAAGDCGFSIRLGDGKYMSYNVADGMKATSHSS